MKFYEFIVFVSSHFTALHCFQYARVLDFFFFFSSNQISALMCRHVNRIFPNPSESGIRTIATETK